MLGETALSTLSKKTVVISLLKKDLICLVTYMKLYLVPRLTKFIKISTVLYVNFGGGDKGLQGLQHLRGEGGGLVCPFSPFL